MAMGFMGDYQVVELSGVPEQDEATLNPYGLIGYEFMAVTTVAATGRLIGYLKRGTLPEDARRRVSMSAASRRPSNRPLKWSCRSSSLRAI